MRPLLSALASVLVAALVVAGCAAEADTPASPDTDTLTVATRADSVALRILEAQGGAEAWASARVLRFDFAVEQAGQKRVVAKHLWNRATGDYRLEWTAGKDSTYVALFDASGHSSYTPPGTVYLNGIEAENSDELMKTAHRRFINDTYWLLAPTKVFDEGVTRTYEPDSSDAATDVIRLSFGEVGLTPGDRYWLYVDRATGEMTQWAYHLQSMDADAAPRSFAWTGHEEHGTPAGPVRVAVRKETPGGLAIVTDAVEIRNAIDPDLFKDPAPQL